MKLNLNKLRIHANSCVFLVKTFKKRIALRRKSVFVKESLVCSSKLLIGNTLFGIKRNQTILLFPQKTVVYFLCFKFQVTSNFFTVWLIISHSRFTEIPVSQSAILVLISRYRCREHHTWTVTTRLFCFLLIRVSDLKHSLKNEWIDTKNTGFFNRLHIYIIYEDCE